MKPFARQLLLAALALFSLGAVAAERTTYFVPDALGSPVVAMDERGEVLWRENYAPWGERRTKSAASDASSAYTGKPEDPDTGLVYMGARMYNPETGRFTGVDPRGISVSEPQSFGRYSYGNNSPYGFIDPDGRWPTSIHERIIDNAFPGLTAAQRSTLKAASSSMDSVMHGGQSQANSYQHSMRAPLQSTSDAKKATTSFIDAQEKAAQKVQGTLPVTIIGLKGDSLTAAGNAMHTVTDGTSPAHTDVDGNPMVWRGLEHPVDAKKHADAESEISESQMTAAVKAAREVFKGTYGNSLYQQAIKERK